MTEITSHLSSALEIIRKGIRKLSPVNNEEENTDRFLPADHRSTGWWSTASGSGSGAAHTEAGTDFNDLTISIADDDDAGSNDGIRIENELFSFENAIYSNEWGNDNAYASLDVLGYDVSGGAYAEIGMDELELGGHASASAYVLQGEAGVGAGPLEAGVEGSIGAQATVEVGVEYDLSEGTIQAEVGGEAFAGAEARATTGIDAGVVEAEVGAEVKAGIGAEFEADFGFEDGAFNMDFDAGAALGVGGGFDFDVTVDVGGIASGAGDAAGWVGDKAGGFVSGAGNLAGDIGSALNPFG